MKNVLDLILKKINKTPKEISVVDHSGTRLTSYKEIDELSGKIATEIIKRGYKKGSNIMIRMPRCVEYLATEIGVLKAGCVFVPLIMDYSENRVKYIMQLCNCNLCIDLDFVWQSKQNKPLELPVELEPNDGAYIIFTSGSTGKPKGIYHTQKSFFSYISGYSKALTLSQNDVFLDTVNYSFILSFFNIIALISGCTIHILNDEERKDIHFIEDYIANEGITFSVLVPSQLRIFNNKSKTLQRVFSAGEKLSNQFSNDYQIINGYGTSETGGSLYFYTTQKYENTPIGTAIDGVYTYILNEHGLPVPDGEKGELCISGTTLAKGYINMPELTAKKFVKNPFSKSDDDKILFHTNDIVKKLPDGNILYIDRNDWMVKINGHRVEPGEIEHTTTAIKGIEMSVVKPFKNNFGQTYLVNYYKANKEISSDIIKRHLLKHLPKYMVPRFFVRLENFPTNANGKIDRNALMPPDISIYKSKYIPPSTKVEMKLCDAFERVLDCGTVGINDDFFLLGGDSIKVMQLQNESGIKGLSTYSIFEGKTPAKIAEIAEKFNTDPFKDCIGVSKNSYPLTPAQMGIYFSFLKNPHDTMYNNPVCYTFSKNSGIKIKKLIEAIKLSVNSHSAFKFRVDNSSGVPSMKPRNITVDIPIIPTRNSELKLIKENFVKPFDLEKDYLFRFSIFETETVYCLVMDFHHIAFDGTSLSIICNEISLAYNNNTIPQEQISQFDLSLFEEKLKGSGAYERAKKYYNKIFSEIDAKSEIVKDFKNDSEDETHPLGELSIFVSNDLSSDSIEKFTKEHGITSNTLFFGAYEYALSKFIGQNKVTICTVNHGRHDSRMQNTVGMMVHTLPIYTEIDENSIILEYLGSVQNNLQNAIKNDMYPFTRLSEEYGISPDLMFVYQPDAINSLVINGVSMKMESIPVNSAISKVSVSIFKTNGGFEIKFGYCSDLYEEENIRSLAEMYVKILSEFLVKEKLVDVQFLNNSQALFIDELNRATERDNNLDYGFLEMFRDQVKRTPDKLALVCGDISYTYSQLDKITDQIGQYLYKKGISTEVTVAVLVKRGVFMTISSIGVLKAGAAYEPLDPTHPSERLQFMIKDANAKLVIADEALLPLIPEYDGEILKTSDISSLPIDKELTLPFPKPEDSSVLFYTSGSTGNPKGCMLVHKNITNLVHAIKHILEITEESSTAAYASYGFDIHIADIYPYLASGATEYIIPEEKKLDLIWINEYMRENKITNFYATTQVTRTFVTTIEDIQPQKIITGGEKLVPFVPKKNLKFFNAYGPTECTVLSTRFFIDKYYESVPIGKGIDNAYHYVVDKQLRMLPPGAVGELCIAGPLVSRGYINLPELTEKVFIKNPFCNKKDFDRLYRTGDLVRLLPDGNIEYIGRNDGMVKVRGFRIELSEVEKVIRCYDGIKDATVVSQKTESGDQCINAYIVSDEKIDINQLNEFIKSKKPSYMVPTATMQIDKIPLNVNGKVDRKKLPTIETSQDTIKKAKTSSRSLTLIEEKIINIVEEIVGHRNFDLSENLIKAGLTSLSFIKLAVALNKEFGFETPIAKMMKGCSIISIENEVQKFLIDSVISKAEQMRAQRNKKNYKSIYPLTKTQLRFYLKCVKNPCSTIYNIPSIFTFPKAINAQKIADCVKQVILAHPYVLTNFVMENENLGQVYVKKTELSVPVINLSESKLESYKKEFVKPYDLSKSPLFRLEVIQTELNVYLLMDIHHLIFDGTSFNIFKEQIKALYEGEKIEPEQYTYFDYVDYEATAQDTEEFKAAEKYFEGMMKNFKSATEIPPDINGIPENGGLAEAFVSINMTKVKNFCYKNEITPAHLFLASTFYVVSRFANEENVYISTVSSGRKNIKFSNSFGAFTKILPLGITIEDLSSIQFVLKARDIMTETIDHEIYPYTEIYNKYGYTANIVYEYQLDFIDHITIDNHEISIDYLEIDKPKFKTAIYIENKCGKTGVLVRYNDALYSSDLMQILARSIVSATAQIIENPERKINCISL